MKIAVITQEEPFYLPAFMDQFLSRIRDRVVLVVGLPSVPPHESRLDMARKFFTLWGPRLFISQCLRYAWYSIADSVPGLSCVSVRSTRGLCARAGIPYAAPRALNKGAFMRRIRECAPDLIVSVAANQIFRKELLELPRLGCINLHAGLLPRYRGINPTFWVLANGETETGVTVHFMDSRLDNGDIIVQNKIPILPDDTLHSLYLKEMGLGVEALCEAIGYFERGDVPRRLNDPAQATCFSYPRREDVRRFRTRGRRFY